MADEIWIATATEASDVRRMRQLEEENARLKSMLADALLQLELLRNRTGRRGSGWTAEIARSRSGNVELIVTRLLPPTGVYRMAINALPQDSGVFVKKVFAAMAAVGCSACPPLRFMRRLNRIRHRQ
jgi:hypothetical protein